MDIRRGVLRDEADSGDSALGLCQAVVISLLIQLILECVTGISCRRSRPIPVVSI